MTNSCLTYASILEEAADPKAIFSQHYEKKLSDLIISNNPEADELEIRSETLFRYFMGVVRADPTTVIRENGTIAKVGDYVKWMMRILLGCHGEEFVRFFEDLPKYKELLAKYDTLKKRQLLPVDKRDINRFHELSDLFRFLREYEDTAGEILTEKIRKETKIVFEDADSMVLIPLTYEASCYWGKGTNWCTAIPDYDNMYKHYTAQGPLYITLSKSDPGLKYQLHTPSAQFMDISDRRADLEQYKTEFPGPFKFFAENGIFYLPEIHEEDAGDYEVKWTVIDPSFGGKHSIILTPNNLFYGLTSWQLYRSRTVLVWFLGAVASFSDPYDWYGHTNKEATIPSEWRHYPEVLAWLCAKGLTREIESPLPKKLSTGYFVQIPEEDEEGNIIKFPWGAPAVAYSGTYYAKSKKASFVPIRTRDDLQAMNLNDLYRLTIELDQRFPKLRQAKDGSFIYTLTEPYSIPDDWHFGEVYTGFGHYRFSYKFDAILKRIGMRYSFPLQLLGDTILLCRTISKSYTFAIQGFGLGQLKIRAVLTLRPRVAQEMLIAAIRRRDTIKTFSDFVTHLDIAPSYSKKKKDEIEREMKDVLEKYWETKK